jgi:hypothetical protein
VEVAQFFYRGCAGATAGTCATLRSMQEEIGATSTQVS